MKGRNLQWMKCGVLTKFGCQFDRIHRKKWLSSVYTWEHKIALLEGSIFNIVLSLEKLTIDAWN